MFCPSTRIKVIDRLNNSSYFMSVWEYLVTTIFARGSSEGMKFLMNWIYRQRGSCFRRCSRYRNSFSEISCSRLSMYLITTPSFAYFLTSFLFPNIDFFTTTSFFLPRNPLIVSLYFLRRSPNTFIIKVLDSFYFLATLIEGSSISREQYILLG